jgi:hypothetical protein
MRELAEMNTDVEQELIRLCELTREVERRNARRAPIHALLLLWIPLLASLGLIVHTIRRGHGHVGFTLGLCASALGLLTSSLAVVIASVRRPLLKQQARFRAALRGVPPEKQLELLRHHAGEETCIVSVVEPIIRDLLVNAAPDANGDPQVAALRSEVLRASSLLHRLGILLAALGGLLFVAGMAISRRGVPAGWEQWALFVALFAVANTTVAGGRLLARSLLAKQLRRRLRALAPPQQSLALAPFVAEKDAELLKFLRLVGARAASPTEVAPYGAAQGSGSEAAAAESDR